MVSLPPGQAYKITYSYKDQKPQVFEFDATQITTFLEKIVDINKSIELAIAEFLVLAPAPEQLSCPLPDLKAIAFLLQQQRRLTEKLKERLVAAQSDFPNELNKLPIRLYYQDEARFGRIN